MKRSPPCSRTIIGHLYFAEAMTAARAAADDRQTRLIELKCDLVALTTLTELKMKPSNLLTAIKKMVAQREKLKIGSFQPGRPTLADRAEVIKLYLAAHPENQKR